MLLSRPINHAVGINVITKKLFSHNMAVGLRNRYDRKSRLYFVTPWRGKSIIGTEWLKNETPPDKVMVDGRYCLNLINGFNAAYPPASLKLDDVDYVHSGLVPCKKRTLNSSNNTNLLNHFRLIDHRDEGLKGVISAVGVKYTTAADVAEKSLRYLYPNLKKTRLSPLPQLAGGKIENFMTFQTEIHNRYRSQVQDEKELSQVILNYGRETEKIIALGSTADSNRLKDDDCDILRGETLFAIREEMAHRLSDVVLRRTQLGTAGQPSESDLIHVSTLMAQELGWSEETRKAEINDVKNFYPPFLSSKNLEIQNESLGTANIHYHP